MILRALKEHVDFAKSKLQHRKKDENGAQEDDFDQVHIGLWAGLGAYGGGGGLHVHVGAYRGRGWTRCT